MDEDMDDIDSYSSYTSSTYSYSHSPYSSYQHKSSPPPPKAQPVLEYNVQFVDTERTGHGKCIDLVFVLDCTGSMQRYINSVRDHIMGICDMIRGEEGLGGPDDVRVAVINYRDHKPQDNTYVYQFHPFSSDIPEIQRYLKGLTAAGGGDGPEAVTSGMAASLIELEWRREAAKMVVLIADAPPHGIGEGGDRGDPEGHDPLVIARTMAQHGITLFMVACEETLSGYKHAVDFFQAICNMTSGLMLPLTTADLLAMTIVSSVLENMDMERLISEIGTHVAERIREKGENLQSVEEVAQELHEKLLLRNEQTKQIRLPEVYVQNEITKANVETWMNAQFIADAVPNIRPVAQKRLTDSFKKSNARSGFEYVPGGRLPPRRTSLTSGAPPTPSSPERTSISSASATSPSRRVVSDFKAFGAASPGQPGKMSVFGAPLLATGPGGGMFGSAGLNPGNSGRSGLRARKMDDDDDEDEDGGVKTSSISLDQARRIATQSVFRAGRLG